MLIKLNGSERIITDRYEILAIIRALQKESCIASLSSQKKATGKLQQINSSVITLQLEDGYEYNQEGVINVSLFGEMCKVDFQVKSINYSDSVLSLEFPDYCLITQRRKNKRCMIPDSLEYHGEGRLIDGRFIDFSVKDLSEFGIGLCVNNSFFELIKKGSLINHVFFDFKREGSFLCSLKILDVTKGAAFCNCNENEVRLSCFFGIYLPKLRR